MKTRITILLLMVAFAFSGFSQTIGDYIDVVYLKNGSIVKGVIIEQIPGQSIKIKTADGSEFFYSIQEVEKFSREGVSVEEKTSSKNKESFRARIDSWMGDYRKKDKGHFAEFGIIVNSSSSAFRITNGYKFSRFAHFGLAIGLENAQINYGERLPEISLNIIYSGEILDKRITPFYQVEAGYGFSLDRYGYNKNLLNGNHYFGDHFDDDYYSDNSYSALNYGGPQGALALGVKFSTKKKVYYKLALDARVTSNFSDSFYKTYDEMDVETGVEKYQELNTTPGLGIRFSIGF